MADRADPDLLARWRAGDQQAAGELFRRYTNRLIGLTRTRLPARLKARVDPEDVVQSVYRSFFAGVSEDRYDLGHGGDLWRLLVTITLHKVYFQVRHHGRDKRTVERDLNFSGEDTLLGLQPDLLARDPSPVEAVALAEQLEQMFAQFTPLQRRIVELRLQGHNLDEIARQTDRTERTVRRVLAEVKEWLARRRQPPESP